MFKQEHVIELLTKNGVLQPCLTAVKTEQGERTKLEITLIIKRGISKVGLHSSLPLYLEEKRINIKTKRPLWKKWKKLSWRISSHLNSKCFDHDGTRLSAEYLLLQRRYFKHCLENKLLLKKLETDVLSST